MSAISGKKIPIVTVYKDKDEDIYIGTRGNGLFVLPNNSRKIERVEGMDINTAKIWAITQDRDGNTWVGCQSKGLFVIPNRLPWFRNWSFSAQKVNLSSTITSVCEGDNGIIWCTVQGNGVFGFDNNGKIVARPVSPSSTEFIFRDSRRQYWLGTDNGFYVYDPETGKSEIRVSFECNKFNDMTDDGKNIYISTFSRGFCVYNPKSRKLKNYVQGATDGKGSLCNNWVMCMMPDRKGRVWLGTASGVSCFSPADENFKSLGWYSLLDGIACHSLCETQDGRILIGTDEGLYVYNHNDNKVVGMPGGEVLKDKTVGYIVEANNGDIWCSTSMGIWQYNKRKKKFIGHVNGNGLTMKEYVNSVGLHTDDDIVYFGNNDGLTVFKPSDIKENTGKIPDICLSDFLIAGKSVNTNTESNGHRVVSGPLMTSDHFTVSYLDNTFSLEFSLFDYVAPGNIIYEYRVNNDDWKNNGEGYNTITLSHLQPGEYNVEVRALIDGAYSKTKKITVAVTPPWYKSTAAYLFYIIMFAVMVAYLIYQYNRKKREQLYEEKMKFLINATHDIRSPLTLIMSPLANLKRRVGETFPDSMRDIATIEHNSKRILDLVSQILDVRKIDKQQMHLHCRRTDIVAFINGIYKMFEYSAQERNIKFVFTHFDESLDVWIDRNQFDKVITNLLSNAFKYTYDNGNIEIRLTSDNTHFVIQVIDSGVGLKNESLKHIFDRFYQGGNSSRLHIPGTGIGLNLCKMIVDMHHGTVVAENRTDAKGSIFTVRIPLGNSHFSSEEISREKTVADNAVKTRPQTKYRVLVVDDDLEIGRYISTELGCYYKFGVCSNGKEGLKELLTNAYDVVVSDVMMPEMDGFTMLRMIKTNINLSHIPVIMLTSKSDVGNRLEGLERGADAFLAKPFDMEELHMNIENVINNMMRLKSKFSGVQKQMANIETKEVKGNDELLMERIMKVVNEHIGDSDFGVDMMTKEVGISRAQLHRKMKELAGVSAGEFIRNIRLEQAARLLREQKLNITQVAYTVGFSNLAHFSTLFRKYFGVPPTEYTDSKQK
ncbi:ATP-binding protein [Xylanibacter muris]|nr:ATP-binding protein [Xylanibacter muris]